MNIVSKISARSQKYALKFLSTDTCGTPHVTRDEADEDDLQWLIAYDWQDTTTGSAARDGRARRSSLYTQFKI
jgi:hypothetical protein